MLQELVEIKPYLLAANAQSFTTFRSAAVNNFSSIFRRHSRSKTVLVLSFSIMRLIRSLHETNPLYFILVFLVEDKLTKKKHSKQD